MKSSNDDTPIDGQCRGKNKQCQDRCIVTTIWMESWGYAPWNIEAIAPITITRLWILMNLVMLRDSKSNGYGYVFTYFLYHFFVSPFLGLRLVHFWRCNSNRGNLVFTSRHGFKPWLAVETKVFCEMYPCRLFGGTACCWYVFLTGLTALHRARAIRPQNESALDIVVWKEEMGKLWETMFFLRFLRLLGFNHNSHSPIHPFLAWHLHFDFDSHGFSPARPTATGWTSWMWPTSSVLFSS